MSKKFRIQKVAFFLILVSLLLTGCSNQWNVDGIVIDEDGNPIAGATVSTSAATTETDQDGKWSASASGESDTITVSKLGYVFESSEVIVMQPEGEELESITFVGRDLEQLFITPDEGEYLGSVVVSLVMGGNYTIHYTLDSSEPTSASTEYTAPFELIETTTVKAIAINNVDASITSDVVEATYEIIDLEFVKNPGFEDGLAYWEGQGDAEVSIDEAVAATGSQSLFVTNRADIAHGPMQYVDGFEFDVTYEISFKVLYEDGPSTRIFNMSHQNGDWQTIFNMATGEATKGEWATIQGTYEFPEYDKADRPIELDGQWIFIETSWVADPTPENDWMDFWVDDFSIRAAE